MVTENVYIVLGICSRMEAASVMPGPLVEALSGWGPSLECLRASRWGVAGEVDWGRQSAWDPPLHEVCVLASSACLGVSEASSRLCCDGAIIPWSVTSSGSRLLITM